MFKPRLDGSFSNARNIVRVVIEGAPNAVGDLHIVRRSGWRGGPTYHFHPNAHGSQLGLKRLIRKSARQVLREIADALQAPKVMELRAQYRYRLRRAA